MEESEEREWWRNEWRRVRREEWWRDEWRREEWWRNEWRREEWWRNEWRNEWRRGIGGGMREVRIRCISMIKDNIL